MRTQGHGGQQHRLHTINGVLGLTGSGPLVILPVPITADTVAVNTDPDVASIDLQAPALSQVGRTVTVVNVGTSGNAVGVNPPGDIVGSTTLADGEARTYERLDEPAGPKWHEISNNT